MRRTRTRDAASCARSHNIVPGVVKPVMPTFTAPRGRITIFGNSGPPDESSTFAETKRYVAWVAARRKKSRP